jgi:hypothetical protein
MPTDIHKQPNPDQPDYPKSHFHEFYSHGYHHEERDALISFIADGVHDEIAMLRVFIRRVFIMANGIDDMDETIRLLDSLGRSTTRLANLVKTQKIVSNDQSETAQQISQAIAEVIKEMGLSTKSNRKR